MSASTLASLAQMPAPRSFWRQRIAERASPLGVHEYLIDEANLRGFWGAFRAVTPTRPIDTLLTIEDVVVGLLAPQAPADARIFKLVLRVLQRAEFDTGRLMLRARREYAGAALFWLLSQIPNEESTPAILNLRAAFGTGPRGYRGLRYRFDPSRLHSRRARKGDLWRKRLD
ncbi:MAG: hypothetical protein ACKVPX_02670 [Myxococcaceae bacterium]